MKGVTGKVLKTSSKFKLTVKKRLPSIRAVAAVGNGAMANKANLIKKTADGKTMKQTWIDLILSKEFSGVIDEVFDRCCLLNDTDAFSDAGTTLDKTELQFATKLLWEKLDELMGAEGKLPRIRESEEDVLKTYDENNDGHISRQEFHGFVRTYFSRLQWPMWRVAAKGAAKGAALHVVNSVFLSPLFDKMKEFVIPRIVSAVKKKVSEKWKRKFVQARRKFKIKFRDSNPFVTDLDNIPKRLKNRLAQGEMPEDIMREIRAETLARRLQLIRTFLVTAALGATASVAGFL